MNITSMHDRPNAKIPTLGLISLACCWLLALPPAFAATAAAPAAEPQASIARGRQLAQTCSACHGATGNSQNPALYPNLAGQSVAYLELQLTNFKSGERPNPLMKGFASALTAAQMHDLAAYFGAQTAKAQPKADAALEEKGKRIFTSGNAAGAPACASCHGAQGHGQAAFPRIASQPAAYTLEQLHVYRDVPKFNNPLATVMKGVAVKLSEDDMKSVSAYVATIP
ncbi:c-type cytochrome [Undibacterium sp.]|uniref:c-type cytochrome n=1 Tax=Undibacterium sp. TaxID=1914977 RepID=UPI00374CC06D